MKSATSIAVILLTSTVFVGAYGEQSQAGDLAAETETVTDEEQYEFANLDDRFSYAYGADLAAKFMLEGVTLNPALLAAGMQDAYSGDDMKMSDGEVTATIELYIELHNQKKEAEMAVLGEKNREEGEVFLAKNAEREGVVVTESGLQYKVITEGSGEYRPTEDDEVTVHYRGRFIDGTEFDSTHQRNQAYSAKVMQLIEGWSEALQLMTEGSKWELYIPPHLAYGDVGSQFVGPNAVLIFDVELLEIEKYDPDRYGY